VTSLEIRIPDNEWLSANDRLHWRPERNRKKALRSRGAFTARSSGLVVPTPCIVVAEIGLRATGRADAENAAPTAKCLIDGLVTAGALPDDSSEHITATTFRLGPRVTEKGWRRITLHFHQPNINFKETR
jgi:hypothetical protein